MAKQNAGNRISDKNEFWLAGGLVLIAMHLYVYTRIRSATIGCWPGALWLVWSAVVMTLPFITRRTDRINHRTWKKWSDRLGVAWSLFAFYVFIAFAAMDLLRRFTGIGLSPARELFAAFAAGALILAFGVRQANIIQTVTIKVPTSKLPAGVERLRVVQLSDLHLGPFTGVLLLAQILRRVREAGPDIVVVTGDLADGVLEGRKRELAMLRRIKPPFGVYAVPATMITTTISTRR